MQTVKALLLVLICISLLAACGLKGPLYLPPDDAGNKTDTEQQSGESADQEKSKKDSEKDKDRVPVSI